jgi:GTP-binding protein HflX
MAGKGLGMSQQAGGIGMRGGPGETAKVKEARHIERSMLQLRRQLETIQKARETQRKKRLNNEIPHVCLIGYTNTGKSTIFNALTKSDVLAQDKLFATLDTTTRELFVAGKKKGIISDTVGFIQLLPTHLIEAFKSTLSELQYADLLIHVVDISDQNWEGHIEVVESILKDLDVEKEMIYVFNKADKINTIEYAHSMAAYQPYVITSATTKGGLAPLISFLQNWTPQKEV